MLRITGLTILAALAFSVSAQVRIDSSFAFSTIPAKGYSIYVPSSYSSAQPNEMMLAFHPLDTNRWNSVSWCDTLLTFAESNDLLLVCPDGGPDGDITDQIDYDFTSALIDSVRNWFNVDNSRIYAMGFASGGKATYEYGLNNAIDFGGFMPIGPAINSSSFVSSVIQNSGRKPFYLVHGSTDSTSTKFYPMITDLLANCAYVDSILMPGIGSTIDFPNRNQILSDAYQWIDSVNLAPVHGTLSLISPISFSSIEVKGFADFEHSFYWEADSLGDSCGVMKYEVLVDQQGGNFSSPLVVLHPKNNGADTFLILTNYEMDSILINLGVALNSSVTIDWTVRSVLHGKASDTAKSFRLTIVRKKLGFELSGPSNNTNVTLQNGNTTFFDWTDLLHYSTLDYSIQFDSLQNDFSNPLLEFPSSNDGANSSVTATHELLYYNLMFRDSIQPGDTIHLKWRAIAEDSIWFEPSGNVRNINFIRGNTGFRLLSPPDQSLILSKKDQNYTFQWDSILLPDISYTVLFDTLGADLKDSASVHLGSDNGRTASRLSLNFEVIDSIMIAYGMNYHDTLFGQWTVKASHTNGHDFAMTTFGLKIVRAHPVGISESQIHSEFFIVPNPAAHKVIISWESNLHPVSMDVIDLYGRTVTSIQIKSTVSSESLDISHLQEATYVIRLNTDKLPVYGKLVINR